MANTFKFGAGEWYGKKDTILAFNDENKNYKPLAFSFSRDSTGTFVNKDGLIETVGIDEPRVDYLDNADGHLLLEPSRTNLTLNSEGLDSGSYTSGGSGTGSVTVTANYGISPDGTQNADRVQLVQGSSYREFYQRVSVTNGAKYTLSFYAKSLSGTPTLYTAWNNGYENEVTFSTEWVRYEYTFTEDSSSGGTTAGLNLITWNNLPSTSSSADLLVWGVQLEQSSYATSLIKTNGSSVTRAADSANQTAPDGVIGQTEGTLFVEYPNIDNLFGFIALSVDGGNTNRMVIYSAGENTLKAQFRQGGSVTLSGTSSVINGKVKAALSFSSTESVFYVNGIQVAVGTATIWSGLNEVNLNQANQIGAKLKDLRVYNTRLSNAELITLTT